MGAFSCTAIEIVNSRVDRHSAADICPEIKTFLVEHCFSGGFKPDPEEGITLLGSGFLDSVRVLEIIAA